MVVSNQDYINHQTKVNTSEGLNPEATTKKVGYGGAAAVVVVVVVINTAYFKAFQSFVMLK